MSGRNQIRVPGLAEMQAVARSHGTNSEAPELWKGLALSVEEITRRYGDSRTCLRAARQR